MKYLLLFMVLVMVMFALTGCARVTDTIKRGIVTLDTKAASNEVIVSKLCNSPGTVTEAEKDTAMQNAHMLHYGTSELRRVVVGDIQAVE